MALSHKHKRELNLLTAQADDLWEDQREILERANRVIREAGRHARDEVSPRVRGAVSAGRDLASAGRGVASSTRGRIVDDVFPVVSSALGSALAIIEAAKDPNVRAALKRVSSGGSAVAARAGLARQRPSGGPGRYILIGVGIVAAAGVAYAAWQTLRADDDLWIDDEEYTEQSGGVQPS